MVGLACMVGAIVFVLRRNILAKPTKEVVTAQHPNDENLNAAQPALGASSQASSQVRTGLPDVQAEGKNVHLSQNISPSMCDENGTYWGSGRYELP